MPAQIEPAELHWLDVYRRPFVYHEAGQWILDSDHNVVLDIRGWGFLTGCGGLWMSPEKASVVQDSIGKHVTELLNNHWGEGAGDV